MGKRTLDLGLYFFSPGNACHRRRSPKRNPRPWSYCIRPRSGAHETWNAIGTQLTGHRESNLRKIAHSKKH
jgi:hypothetical protein